MKSLIMLISIHMSKQSKKLLLSDLNRRLLAWVERQRICEDNLIPHINL